MSSSRYSDSDVEKSALCERLKRLRVDQTLCDVKLSCQSFEFAAHRIVLAAQSDWFLKAFTNGFAETGANAMILQEDEPSVIAAMLDFCYTLEYDDSPEDCTFPLAGGGGLMAFNVHVFAAAEKYLIEPLQRFALNRLRYHAGTFFDPDDFASAVEHAYTATSDPKRVLRRTIMKISFDRADELFSKDTPFATAAFDAMADRVTSYTADMMRAAQRTGRLGEERQQLSCPTDFCYNTINCEVDADGFLDTQCDECEHYHYGPAQDYGLVAYPDGFNAGS